MKKRIYELEANECKWPLDFNEDGEQLFCCRVAPDGLPYCPAHGRMSTASGADPSPMNPWGEPEFPRQRRDYLDAQFDRRVEHEPDLVELLGQDAGERRFVDGLSDRLRQIAEEKKERVGVNEFMRLSK